MKAVILAGGFGSRISEESAIKPKPMIEIGNKPILWHILKIYSHFGINEFIICLGYKGEYIKDYFANYHLNQSDVKFNLADKSMKILKNGSENWQVTLIDTGEQSMTGGRLKRVEKYIGKETFCLTYGDGVTDLNIDKLITFHKKQKKIATVTAVQPPGRFGALNLVRGDAKVHDFREKPHGDGSWINGGFFVLEPEIFQFIKGDKESWEQQPMMRLTKKGELVAFRHYDFWQPMDTLRDKNYLEKLWQSGRAPWKVWK